MLVHVWLSVYSVFEKRAEYNGQLFNISISGERFYAENIDRRR